MQQGQLPKARRLMQTVRAHASDEVRRPKWIANASIGLSRIERRDHDFAAAIDAARLALREVGGEQKKIERRARGSLARALAAAAIATPTTENLEDAQHEIDGCLRDLDREDVRNRLTLDLWNALVLHAMGDRGAAERALQEYERHAPRVDIGRIKEFAQHVIATVRASTSELGLPVERGDYRLQVNLDAMELLVFRRVETIPNKTKRAKALDISRDTYYKRRSRFPK